VRRTKKKKKNRRKKKEEEIEMREIFRGRGFIL
jgi:hypothetical protein